MKTKLKLKTYIIPGKPGIYKTWTEFFNNPGKGNIMNKKLLRNDKLVILIAILGVVFAGLAASTNAKQELSKIIFYVGWYDVGKSALAGLKGVVKVKSGFLGSREVNTVFYNPNLISREEMIEALKKADTYQGVAEEK